MKKWITDGRKEIFSTRLFKVFSNARHSESGKKGDFYSMVCHDWATVLHVSERDGKRYFTMVRQYRHGIDSISSEFPCGNIEWGEDPKAGALRELKEETGIVPDSIELLGKSRPNAALNENTIYYFLAEGVRSKSEQNLDENEEIEVFEMDEDEVVLRYMGVDEEACSGTMLPALLFYLRKKGMIRI